jgi:response regulator RpfG family c-di-GMP phosphodiesterase
MMPGELDGFGLVKKIKKSISDPPVMFLMTGSETPSQEQIKESGAEMIFYKPFSSANLVESINNVLKERCPYEIRRQHSRFKIQRAVKIKNPEYKNKIVVSDLSRGGVFLELDDPFPIGTELEIEISLDQMFSTKVKVVWCKLVESEELGKGNGMHFIAKTKEFEKALHEFLSGQGR